MSSPNTARRRFFQRLSTDALAAAVALAMILCGSLSVSGVAYAAPTYSASSQEDVATARVIDGQPVLFQYGRPVPGFLLPEPLPPQRQVISLDGAWLFTADPNGTLTLDSLQAGSDTAVPETADAPESLAAGPGETRLEETASIEAEPGDAGSDAAQPNRDFAWREVLVPHVWDHEAGLETFDGPAWYLKSFELPATAEGRRVRLVFLGAADEAIVYVNGKRAGFHRGAYMPFALDVTELVRPGEPNEVLVRLRRRAWGATERSLLPPGDHDWWLYGGLFQSVYAEILPELSVARILTGYDDGTMKGVVVMHNDGTSDRRVVVRFDPGWEDEFEGGPDSGVRAASAPERPLTYEASIGAGRTAAIPFELAASEERLWTPSHPRTYTATAEVIDLDTGETIDLWQEHYGLVDVAVSGSRLLLGGEPLFIKGVNWHADDPEVGAAYRTEHFERDFELMLAAGANLVRFSHYPRHPEAYRLADRRGLMVMDEAPNYWMDRSSILHQLQDGLSATYVRSMVWNHMNHPSVILWSVLNESATSIRGGTAARDFIAQLTGAVRELDLSSRPVTYASNHHRDDIGFHAVDVIGVNEYFGFFYGVHQDLGPYLDYLRGRYPGKPVLITEFGDWAVYGTGRQATQSFTFQAHWRQMIERSAFVAGGIWWVFADHKSRHQPESAIPYISTMGMVDRDRRPKTLFHVFRDAPLPAAGADDEPGR